MSYPPAQMQTNLQMANVEKWSEAIELVFSDNLNKVGNVLYIKVIYTNYSNLGGDITNIMHKDYLSILE